MIIGIIVTIGVVAFFGYCIISSTGMDEEERKREDEDQIEYIRRWNKEHDKN